MLRRHLEGVLSAPPSWLGPILIPLSLVYAGAAAVHRGLYRLGILKPARLPRPVVSVGNLTAGGGGKTPLVMWLAETLTRHNVTPAILTRGYGRQGSGIRIVGPGDIWSDVGDEPAMLAARLPEVPVAVSADRHAAGRELLRQRDVDLYLLDDGFQHRALGRDLDIVVIDGRTKFGNGRLLPAGILREPLSELKGADLIIVTKTGDSDPVFENYLHRFSTAPVYWADYQPMDLRQIGPAVIDAGEGPPSGPVLAFCGIAGPEGFRLTLERTRLEVVDLLAFPDHHPYKQSDINKILEAAAGVEAVGLVTTEKDAARLPVLDTTLPVYFLPVHPEIQGAERIIEQVVALVGEKRAVPRE